MNKSEFASLMSQLHNITQTQANIIIDAFTNSVAAALGEGHAIQLVGFGSFEPKHVPEKEGRNPQTGAPIKLKSHVRPTFKAGKGLKDAVN